MNEITIPRSSQTGAPTGSGDHFRPLSEGSSRIIVTMFHWNIDGFQGYNLDVRVPEQKTRMKFILVRTVPEKIVQLMAPSHARNLRDRAKQLCIYHSFALKYARNSFSGWNSWEMNRQDKGKRKVLSAQNKRILDKSAIGFNPRGKAKQAFADSWRRNFNKSFQTFNWWFKSKPRRTLGQSQIEFYQLSTLTESERICSMVDILMVEIISSCENLDGIFTKSNQ